MKDDVPGYFEQQISQEEDAGTCGEHCVRKPQLLLHTELGEPDIHPVEISKDIATK